MSAHAARISRAGDPPPLTATLARYAADSWLAIAIAVAIDDDSGDAPAIVRAAAKVVGGGGGGKDRRLAVGGGRDVAAIESALGTLREALNGTAGVSRP